MWQTPKTDWEVKHDADGNYIGDYFNAADYNRIAQNIEYLQEIAQSIYPSVLITQAPIVTVEAYAYSSYFDLLETNLETLASKTYRPSAMPSTVRWYGNAPAPRAGDFNRLETSCLLLKKVYDAQISVKPKLAFKLKGSEF